ncbi:hypothetical protein L6452_39200 [Arctium lappa]|uniref:Uncharacterized protein n=1 Tax=Arctium lappa TaxID=4217 RepID=A0ACB8XS70_ARCLA|nr:hypothetical protein L6452_39200 [Arctium lappa]
MDSIYLFYICIWINNWISLFDINIKRDLNIFSYATSNLNLHFDLAFQVVHDLICDLFQARPSVHRDLPNSHPIPHTDSSLPYSLETWVIRIQTIITRSRSS